MFAVKKQKMIAGAKLFQKRNALLEVENFQHFAKKLLFANWEPALTPKQGNALVRQIKKNARRTQMENGIMQI